MEEVIKLLQLSYTVQAKQSSNERVSTSDFGIHVASTPHPSPVQVLEKNSASCSAKPLHCKHLQAQHGVKRATIAMIASRISGQMGKSPDIARSTSPASCNLEATVTPLTLTCNPIGLAHSLTLASPEPPPAVMARVGPLLQRVLAMRRAGGLVHSEGLCAAMMIRPNRSGRFTLILTSSPRCLNLSG